jgi:hypothetical protein
VADSAITNKFIEVEGLAFYLDRGKDAYLRSNDLEIQSRFNIIDDEFKAFKSLAKLESNLSWINYQHRFILRDIRIEAKALINKLTANFDAPTLIFFLDIVTGIAISIEGP